MKKIPLTRGKETLVDDGDFEIFGVFNWYCTEHGYAARRDSEDKLHYLHRDITNASTEEVVDHINCNKLDNRRVNLRKCTQAENTWNARNKKVGKSGFIGVYTSDTGAKQGWHLKKKYAAKIHVNGKSIWLGRYATPEEAHRVYVDACNKYHGSFSKFLE